MTKTQITIEDQRVTVARKSLLKSQKSVQFSLTDLVKNIHGNSDFPLLPKGTRYFSHDQEKKYLILEQPPTIRSIVWITRYPDYYADYIYKTAKFFLAFPYVIFIFKIIPYKISSSETLPNLVSNPYMFYRNQPFESLDDPVFDVNLPNIDKFYQLCMGGYDTLEGRLPIHRQIENRLKLFWESPFKEFDYNWLYEKSRLIDHRIHTVEVWEKNTRHDPAFILTVPWITNAYSLRKRVRQEPMKSYRYLLSDLADMMFGLNAVS